MSMDSLELYRQVAAEIRCDEVALKKKREFAAFLYSRLSCSDGIDPPRQSVRTLRSVVEGIVRRIGADDFNATSVYEALRGEDVEQLPPKVRVNTVLTRMTEVGEILLVRKGVGNQPNWYRLAVI